MSGFEWNKIVGAILLAGLIAMVVGNIADILYRPNLHPTVRGFKVEVDESQNAADRLASKAVEEKPDINQLLSQASLDKGKKIAKKCAMCHTFNENGHSKVGPNLWGVVGADLIHSASYAYSPAFKKKGGDWSYESLFAFLTKPKAFIPGTKMSFAGLRKPQDVADVIVYLRSLSNNPHSLPAAK